MSSSELITKWTDWSFAVRVHQGKEPEFSEAFEALILESKEVLPETTYRFSKYKKLRFLKEGDNVNTGSFIALAKTKDDIMSVDKNPHYSEGTLMIVKSTPVQALYIESTNEYVLPRGYDLRVTKRVNEIEIECELFKVVKYEKEV